MLVFVSGVLSVVPRTSLAMLHRLVPQVMAKERAARM